MIRCHWPHAIGRFDRGIFSLEPAAGQTRQDNEMVDMEQSFTQKKSGEIRASRAFPYSQWFVTGNDIPRGEPGTGKAVTDQGYCLVAAHHIKRLEVPTGGLVRGWKKASVIIRVH